MVWSMAKDQKSHSFYNLFITSVVGFLVYQSYYITLKLRTLIIIRDVASGWRGWIMSRGPEVYFVVFVYRGFGVIFVVVCFLFVFVCFVFWGVLCCVCVCLFIVFLMIFVCFCLF